MRRWRIAIEARPHSTGNGNEADQKLAGDRIAYFYVDAGDISDAVKMARCFSQGMQHNPMVWEAVIVGVHWEKMP